MVAALGENTPINDENDNNFPLQMPNNPPPPGINIDAAVVLPPVDFTAMADEPPMPVENIDPLLMPNDVLWEEIDDVVQEKYPDVFGRKSNIQITRSQDFGVEKIEDYFYLLFPMGELDKIVEGTSEVLIERRKPVTTKGEILKYLGIRLASVLERRRGSVRSWFKDGYVEEESIHLNGAYTTRFNMTVTRFQLLSDSFRLRPAPISAADNADRWYMIRSFIDAFNVRRRKAVIPGQTLVIDESMSAFRQKASGDFNVNGMPHLVKIARKPEGVGAEFKSLADPYTGIIMVLEIQEGRDAMRAKEKCAELGAGAACTWRLTKHWHGSGRTIIGDSWFGSYKCALALASVGLYCIMMVKTAYRCYPLRYLKNWAAAEERRTDEEGLPIPWGNHKVLRHVEPNPRGGPPFEFYALGHRDRKLKTIISNKGTTLPGEPMHVERSRIVYEDGRAINEYYLKTTPRCKMMELLFDDFSVIDIENHRRQGVLRVEKFWLTKSWWVRCFSSVGIGMCVVDAYLLYKCEWEDYSEDGEVMDFVDYAGRLAHRLINNIYLQDTPVLRPRAQATPPVEKEPSQQVCR